MQQKKSFKSRWKFIFAANFQRKLSWKAGSRVKEKATFNMTFIFLNNRMKILDQMKIE